MRFPILTSLVALAVGAQAAPTQAAEPSSRATVIAGEFGLVDSPRHLTDAGPDGSVLSLPEYLGVVIDRRILPHLHVDGQFGVNAVIGLMGSVSARLAIEVSRLTISAGAGPLVGSGVTTPPAIYADTDVSAFLHFSGPFVLLLRVGAAWALADRGSQMCGVDTCNTYLSRGDRVLFARFGLGGSF